MTKISLWVLILVFTTSLAWAQDAATQQQLDKLSGQIQDMIEAQAQQSKRIESLDKEISDLRDKVNTPVANDYVSHDELKKIADQISEVDRKRQADSDMIATQISNLAKAAAVAPPPPIHHSSNTSTTSTPDGSGSGPDNTSTPQNGYYYPIKSGDTLSLIVKAYRDKGVKVTSKQVLKANPGLDPNKLLVGKKIFIPDPSAK
ncbi:MAG TPA: LysM peptidoglycan-binding domain-containing protein [Verrucomicrobiae bacterium]|nr:LysM peptidoglycan-binding domain-containing protein [Verrucomicrobiae bacterium]